MAILRWKHMHSLFAFCGKSNIFLCMKGKTFSRVDFHRYFVTESILAEDVSEYQGVVGLEVHAQINAKSKLFSYAPTTYGSPTNTNVSYFDAALPGTLPVLNRCCVEAGILTALALNCTVHRISTFDRKHYFYPDLPAGFQITQQFHPLATKGHINFVVRDKEKGSYQCCAYLKQLQLEQDSGKSFHVKGQKSLVDLNRAGIGLMELVFEPNLKNGTEAAALIKELVLILKRLGTCSCEMEKGMLRVDANISVHKAGDPLGVRTEVKNINSFRYVSRAIDFEIERQIQILQNGGVVLNETRAYDYDSKKTVFMRDKEMLQDYRFMPEPNLPPIDVCDQGESIEDFKKKLPQLPEAERSRLIEMYSLPLEMVDKLVDSDGLSELFEKIASNTSLKINDNVLIGQFLLTTVLSQLNARKITFKNCDLSPLQITELIYLVASKEISDVTAYNILEMLLNGDQRSCKNIVDEYNWYLISDEQELTKLCLEVMRVYSKVVKKYRKSMKKRGMTTLLLALNEKVNNRASIKDAEAIFKKLICSKSENTKDTLSMSSRENNIDNSKKI